MDGQVQKRDLNTVVNVLQSFQTSVKMFKSQDFTTILLLLAIVAFVSSLPVDPKKPKKHESENEIPDKDEKLSEVCEK